MKEKQSKNSRILDMYVRFCSGRTIKKPTEALRFDVDERTIQRDIDDIRAYLSEQATRDSSEYREIVYDRKKKGFVMKGNRSSFMSNSEILAVSKIILESRAFTKKEIIELLDKIVLGCVPESNMKLVSDLLANEKYHYVELRHKKKLKDLLWDFGEDIRKHRRVEITYSKETKNNKSRKYVIEPVGIMFSEYYFYLNAYINEISDKGEYMHKYKYPAIFRLDRIVSRKDTGEKFKMVYSNRFEEGEFRNRIQFMYAGELIKIQFRYYGPDVDAILDRLPTAKITGTYEEYFVIDAEVYGTGIIMWLLSQGNNVEVIRPKKLRLEMKEKITEMLSLYD